jgi:poly(3-hydroxybutyrate) depolymerase/CubicO group peptidase (beta-lactamase class C family)
MTLFLRFGAWLGFLLLAGTALGPPASGEAPKAEKVPPGTHTYQIEVKGVQRTYMVRVPPVRDEEGKALAVVMMFHGGGGNAKGVMWDTSWHEKADAEGFIAVFPEGTPPDPSKPGKFKGNPQTWNDGSKRSNLVAVQRKVPDVAFVSALLDDLGRRLPVDERRIYATGFSNGASMSFRLARELSTRIAAAAPVAGCDWMADVKPERFVPLLYITGTADPLNPIKGGEIRIMGKFYGKKTPTRLMIEGWVRRAGCPEEPRVVCDREGTKGLAWGNPGEEPRVVYYTLEGHGHHWPGGKTMLPGFLAGENCAKVSATDLIWEFFIKHTLAGIEAASPSSGIISEENCRRAAAYSAKHRGISMLVMVEGEVVFEDYPNGGSKERAHELASGTKSFTGVLAAAAVQDGWLSWDEKVSQTVTEWKEDPRKAKVTVRQLLHLVSGVVTGGEKGDVPTYAEAVQVPFDAEPGEKFKYGAVPFQIFGELVRRKLEDKGESPLDYLRRRVFEPIGLSYGSWKRTADGHPRLPSGAALTARNWAKFGEFVRCGGEWDGRQIIETKILDECFKGSEANPAYGLTWWLNREVTPEIRRRIPQLRRGVKNLWEIDCIPKDMVMAMGAGKQHLYISRKRNLVVLRQASGIRASLRGQGSGYSEAAFLRLLFTGEAPADAKEGEEDPEADAEAKARAERLIRFLDRDGDGKLSEEEAPQRFSAWFDRVDSSGDGFLDVDELAELYKRLGGRGR